MGTELIALQEDSATVWSIPAATPFSAAELEKLVGQLSLVVNIVEQPRVDRHAATGHTPGIDRVRPVYQGHAPLPVPGAGVLLHRGGHQSPRDHLDTVRQQRIVQQFLLLVELLHGGDVGLLGFHDSRLR